MTNVRLTMQEEKGALRKALHTLSAPAVKYNNVQQTSGKKHIRDVEGAVPVSARVCDFDPRKTWSG